MGQALKLDNIFPIMLLDSTSDLLPGANPDLQTRLSVKKYVNVLNSLLKCEPFLSLSLRPPPGNIIGSGIFVSPKGVMENASSVGVALIVWIITGIITAIGALCYAELGVTIPKSGGDYSYVKDIFGGLAGWVSRSFFL